MLKCTELWGAAHSKLYRSKPESSEKNYSEATLQIGNDSGF